MILSISEELMSSNNFNDVQKVVETAYRKALAARTENSSELPREVTINVILNRDYLSVFAGQAYCYFTWCYRTIIKKFSEILSEELCCIFELGSHEFPVDCREIEDPWSITIS